MGVLLGEWGGWEKTGMPMCFRPRQPPNPTSVAACAAGRETAGGYRIGGRAVPELHQPVAAATPCVKKKYKGLFELGLVVEVKALYVVHQLYLESLSLSLISSLSLPPSCSLTFIHSLMQQEGSGNSGVWVAAEGVGQRSVLFPSIGCQGSTLRSRGRSG